MAQKKQDQKLIVKKNPENPEPVELIAQSIIDVSNAWKKVRNSGLTLRALVVLIQDADKNLNQRDIHSVLDIVPRLADRYVIQKG